MPREIAPAMDSDLSKSEASNHEFRNRPARLIYAKHFLDSLSGLLHRIKAALHDNDIDMALDAILSLKIATSVIGGSMVENRCLQIERATRTGKLHEARQVVPDLEDETSALEEALYGLLNETSRTRSEKVIRAS